MRVVCFGELLIDFVALESGVQVGDASGFQKAPGGAPANVAVALARLGVPSAFLGQVGDDPFGHYLAGVLQSDEIDVSGLRFSNEARTALAFVSLAEHGERSFMFYRHPSADMLMRPEDVDTAQIDQASVFHFGSITLIGEPSRSATLHAARHAQSAGVLVSYDPNLRLPLWSSVDAAREGMLIGFEYANIVKISDEEVQFLTGSDDVSSLWHAATQLIVVTHGKDGCTAYWRDGTGVSAPSYDVMPVDTTGAGDGFVAGLLAGILEQGTSTDAIASILPFANAVGALATTQRGAIPSFPSRNEAEQLMKAQ